MSDDENLIDDTNEITDDTTEGTTVALSETAAILANKEVERQRLQADVEAFLARGGQIDHVENNVIADVPKKPEVKYGGQPI